MPELPEVETVVGGLQDDGLVGRTIERTRVYWRRTLGGASPAAFDRQLRGRTITSIDRRGKYIVIGLSGGHRLLIHLRMTGRLALSPAATSRDEHDRVIIELDHGCRLVFHDTRKFGRWAVVPCGATCALDCLGPEPLDGAFTARRLGTMLAGRKRMLKPLLLDQTFLAGLGNIYVDEALWEARLHPARSAVSLSHDDHRRLHGAIRRVLRQGIRAGGTTLGKGQSNFYALRGNAGRNQARLNVFRRVGAACPRCGTPIERIVLAQRSTHVCPACQPAETRP